MTTTTILLLSLSVVLAVGLSYFQYYFRTTKTSITPYLAALRFISVFGVLLLLVNPVISNKTYEQVKTPLPVVIDNSSSIKELKADQAATEVYNKLISDKRLGQKFDVRAYRFDTEFEQADSIDFKGRQTNIEQVAKNLKSIYRNSRFPIALITDGNQTVGEDYVYGFSGSTKVYPIAVGDTTTFLDLRIAQVNVNKYAFHKNKFPAEVFIEYAGNKSIDANFSIGQGGTVYDKQQIRFSPSKRSAVINVLLPADKTGLQIFRATISSSEKEKNSYNNSKNFAVEVIDQKSQIAIISASPHPDLGALKRAIETNAQRKAEIIKPKDVKSLSEYNVLILYQPDNSFRSIFEMSRAAGVNIFLITGNSADYNLLNSIQDDILFKMSSQSESYLADFNDKFNLFAADDIGFSNLPPLENAFGTISVKSASNNLLGSRIRNIATNAPLLTFVENKGKRSAYLFGEGIWKWRLQSHIDNSSFEKFDVFIDKIIQYLASNNSRKSLVVNHESFYNSGDEIEISAQYFNKNYEFDEKARLTISVKNRQTKQSRNYDLLKSTNTFKANLEGLPAGQYDFAVRELNSKTTYNGYFEVLDFDIEKQFVNPDWKKLSQLAAQTQGKAFLASQADQIIKTLLSADEYKTIEKAVVKKMPLIDWKWLLVIIAIALSAEWFLRKYHGMV